MTAQERKALHDFDAAVRRHYGDRLVDIIIFGSRARGDARPDSDADLAIILEDGNWKYWDEQMLLSGLAYDVLLDHELYIQPWPLRRSAWESPRTHPNPAFVAAIHKDGRRIALHD